MSDFKDPDNKQEPTSGQQTNIETPQHAELSPYRQAEATSTNKSAKLPP
ncbi:MAG TPA: efflux RND transporter periplasmic adaptor subunit, partial [Psychrobacter sp.]|nr:efflux RND transporter periplasmic adaptor subunit [Psychrobacter sp.]